MKKAILLVSFGTSYEDTRKKTLDAIEEKVIENFSEYEIRKAYTSHRIIKKLKDRDGIHIDNPMEALQKLKDEGFEEVIVQPTHIIPGEEYDYIKNSVMHNFKRVFERISVGRPLLYFKCEEEGPDDYKEVVEALRCDLEAHKAIIFMGHGTAHPANASYPCLESVMWDEGFENAYMGTVEGYPTLDRAISHLERNKIEEVTLMPFLIVAGDHARNDMASDEEDSWKSILESKGYKVNIVLKGLGENKGIQEIFINRVKDAISGEYELLGKTKK